MTFCADSNDFFATRRIAEGGTHPHRIKVGKGGAWPKDVMRSMSLQPQERQTRKTFAQKRVEEEKDLDVALVGRLQLAGAGLDSDAEDEPEADADLAGAAA